ncbi:hypothetical protein [Desulfospira joergensenii]|uniref:hypothetical protein n=1 Tax=Desulfospira joergensenii TaxID=53329 RepID=UPI0003B68EBE|nr:hypothetical protein [Desulfospira joergensenii]
MKETERRVAEHRCRIKEQTDLVDEMTQCDESSDILESKYECYSRKTKTSRESKACDLS